MTEGEIRTLTRYLINEQDSVRILDTTLDIHLQSALEAFNRRVWYKLTESSSFVTIVAGTHLYTVPAGMEELLIVEWNTIPLRKGHWREWREKAGRDWRSKTGAPQEYCLEGRSILIFPTPDAASVADDNTLFGRYVAAAGAFDDTELAFIGSQSHRILAYYAAYEWIDNPANSVLGEAYARSLLNRFEIETKEVANQYGRRELQK